MLARRFLKEREQQGSNVLIIKGALEVENAMRLMMLGKNQEAERAINEAIEIKLRINDIKGLFQTFIYQSMLQTNLKDWNSVVKSSYCAKQYDLYLTDNFSRMLRTINSLNLVCAFHHQRQFDKEKAELNELFKEIEILCRNFLKEEEYLSMKERNLFIFSNNNENNLKNIGRIFINIYGNQDNFILTYVHQLVKLWEKC